MLEGKIYKPKEFAKMLNVTVKTLQRWDKAGVLIANRTNTNRRFYTHKQYMDFVLAKKNIIYFCGEKIEEEKMMEFASILKKEGVERIEEIQDTCHSDGFRRKAWGNLLERCLLNEIQTIYLFSELDLPQSGLEYYKKFFQKIGVDIKVLEEGKSQNDKEE